MSTQNPKTDDFLSQIQKAEKEVEDRIAEAQAQAQKKLNQQEAKLREQKQASLDAVRERARKQIKVQQEEAKVKYKSMIEEGDNASAQLRKTAEPQLDKSVSMAQEHFLKDILAS